VRGVREQRERPAPPADARFDEQEQPVEDQSAAQSATGRLAVVVTVVAVRVTMGVPLRSARGGCRWAVACVLVLAVVVVLVLAVVVVLVLAVIVVAVLAVVVVGVLAVVVVPVVVARRGLLAVDVSLTSGHRG
jgi:hypothetical protein